jgi:hypothetical protein
MPTKVGPTQHEYIHQRIHQLKWNVSFENIIMNGDDMIGYIEGEKDELRNATKYLFNEYNVKKFDTIEQFYGESYESKYDKIYEMLIDDNFRNLTPKDNKLIIATLITMFFRTTRLISEHNQVMNRVFKQLANLCEQTGKDYFMYEDKKVMMNGRSAEQLLEDIKFYRPVDINLLKDLSQVQKNSNNMLGYHLTNSEFLFYSGRYEEALRDLQEARRIARNNFKIREIITERILILQSYVQPSRRRS